MLVIEEFGRQIQVDYGATSPFDPNQVVPSYMARVQDARAATGRSGFLARR